jgi:hypothetical protein
LAIWRRRTLKARLGIGVAAAVLVAGAVYVAATEHLWLKVTWHDQDSLAYRLMDDPLMDDPSYGAGSGYDPRQFLRGLRGNTEREGVRRALGHFVVGDVTIANVGLREAPGRELHFELVGTDGIVYDQALLDGLSDWSRYETEPWRGYVRLRRLTELPTMVYGGAVWGNVVFEVPKGVEPRRLRLKRAKPAREGQR